VQLQLEAEFNERLCASGPSRPDEHRVSGNTRDLSGMSGCLSQVER
jgi:hypothetical protein